MLARAKRTVSFLRDRLKLNECYKATFDSPQGEVVLRHLLKTGYVFDTTYVEGDDRESAHREGMRRLVLSICRQIQLTEDQLREKMEQEYD